jgi:hypothetical protein
MIWKGSIDRAPVVGPSAMRVRGWWWSTCWRSRLGSGSSGRCGPEGVVLDPPVLHQHSRFEQAAEGLDSEQPITQPAASLQINQTGDPQVGAMRIASRKLVSSSPSTATPSKRPGSSTLKPSSPPVWVRQRLTRPRMERRATPSSTGTTTRTAI